MKQLLTTHPYYTHTILPCHRPLPTVPLPAFSHSPCSPEIELSRIKRERPPALSFLFIPRSTHGLNQLRQFFLRQRMCLCYDRIRIAVSRPSCERPTPGLPCAFLSSSALREQTEAPCRVPGPRYPAPRHCRPPSSVRSKGKSSCPHSGRPDCRREGYSIHPARPRRRCMQAAPRRCPLCR